MRIVSLLPSATEIVCALGLRDGLVGVTHECDHPETVRDLPTVTTTLIPHDATSGRIDALVREQLTTENALYRLDRATLTTLAPDLIVTQSLCDVCAVAADEVIDAACHLPGGPPVINLEPMSLDDVFDAVLAVGAATGRGGTAADVVTALRRRVAAVADRTTAIRHDDRPRVAFLEWIDPLFNGGHWNPELVALAGGIDVLGSPGQASRTTTWEQLVDAEPDVVFISCCGFVTARALEDLPILQANPRWATLPAVRAGRVFVTDGNAYFSRPGPRLVDSLEILAHALHPDLHPPGPVEAVRATPHDGTRATRGTT
jgi:iron complex transport system substrate-binding protein